MNRAKLRQVRRREGRYLLRTNLTDRDPASLWELYMRLVQVEEAFKTLKGDLALRPIHHQLPPRIEAHIFVAFLAYALHATLRRRLRDLAPGLTSRAVLDKFRAIQMVDVHLPTTDGRETHPRPLHAAGARRGAAAAAAPAAIAGPAAAPTVRADRSSPDSRM